MSDEEIIEHHKNISELVTDEDFEVNDRFDSSVLSWVYVWRTHLSVSPWEKKTVFFRKNFLFGLLTFS